MNTFWIIALAVTIISASASIFLAMVQIVPVFQNIKNTINNHNNKKSNHRLLVITIVAILVSIVSGSLSVLTEINLSSVLQHNIAQAPIGNKSPTAVSGSSTFTPTPIITLTPSPSASPTTPVTSACPFPIGSKLFYPIQSLTIPLGCVGVLTAFDGDINGQLWFQKGVLLAIPHGIYNGSFENGEFYFYSVDTASIQFCTLYHKLISDGNHVAKQLPLPSWQTCL